MIKKIFGISLLLILAVFIGAALYVGYIVYEWNKIPLETTKTSVTLVVPENETVDSNTFVNPGWEYIILYELDEYKRTKIADYMRENGLRLIPGEYRFNSFSTVETLITRSFKFEKNIEVVDL